MKKRLLLIAALACLNNCFAQNIAYPTATVKPVTDEYFKIYKVTDDYRWMENQDDATVKKWVADENDITTKFISKASGKNSTENRLNVIGNVKFNAPLKKRNYYFFNAYYDEISAPALFMKTTLNGEARVLVDPNFISRKDKISIRGFEVSRNSKYLAYKFSRNGSDKLEINIINIDGGGELKDHLTDVKFSAIAWQGDGFFYSKYPNTDPLGKIDGQMVYYHKLNTPQSEDVLIFKRTDPTITFDFMTTTDERFFVLEEHNKNAKYYNSFYTDSKEPSSTLKPLLMRLSFGINVIDNHGDKLIASNFHDAENGSIIEIDPKDPYKWRAIASSFPESLLLEALPLKDKLITIYQSGSHPNIVAMDYDGKIIRNLAFPTGTAISGLNGSSEDTELLYSYQSYTMPPVGYSMNTDTYERHITQPSTVSYDFEDFVYQQTEYTTNDSVKVPLLLIYKKGIKLDGTNPTLLEAYGGFGAVSTPHFDPGIIYFLGRGGVYAYASIRGGGELGTKWANAGRGRNKQRSFSDFIAAAEYLIKQGYTSPAKLAISGASNGGLVVAAAAIQRPDLFKAVVPVVAPFDMLRFEKFTVGSLHVNEYGTVSDSTGFKRLYNYSPYNNIKPNVNYPAMLIITSDNDDRVPPLHSFKFAAKMQSRPAQTNPVYLLVNKQAGHYGISSRNLIARLQEETNLYSFIIEMLK